MANAMQSINSGALGGNTPSYSVQQGVRNDYGASQIASAANTVIGSVGAAYQQGVQEDAAKDKSAALTGLSQELVTIAKTGKTADIDVESLQQDAVLRFQSKYKQYGVDGAKLYEDQTGRNLAGLTRKQEQEQAYLKEAQTAGWGDPTDSKASQRLQADLYHSAIRKDKENKIRIEELNRLKQEGAANDATLKKETLGMFKDTSKIYSKRADLLVNSVMEEFQSTNDPVKALAKIKKFELEISRGVGNLGQYAQDPAVTAYLKPINDILAYTKDRINGVPETESEKARTARIRSFYELAYMQDGVRARQAIVSSLTNYVPEVNNIGNAMSWVAHGADVPNGSTSALDPTKGTKYKQLDFTEFSTDEQKAAQEIGKVVMKTSDQDAKMEHVLKVDSAVQFLGKNFEDFDQEDYDTLISIANEPGVFENLSDESRQKWGNVMAQATVDFVSPSVSKFITNAQINVPLREQINGLGVPRGGPDYGPAFGVPAASSGKPLSDFVDWEFSNEGVSFTPKEGVDISLAVRSQILQTKANIQKTILPTLQLTAKALEMPVAEVAKMFIPKPAEPKPETTEESQGIQFGADRVNSMRDKMLELKGQLYDEQSKENPDLTKVEEIKAQLRRRPSEPVKKEVSNADSGDATGSGDGGVSSGEASNPVDLNTVKGTQTYYGDDAVAQVEKLEGSLTEAQKRVVQDEGYVNGYYEDDTGVKTGGVGQTGEWLSKSFKESYTHHEDIAKKAITNFDGLSEEVKGALVSAAYRGDLSSSDDWVKLFNEGNYQEASVEFLNHDEYRLRKASGGDGVTTRMERIANEIAGGN